MESDEFEEVLVGGSGEHIQNDKEESGDPLNLLKYARLVCEHAFRPSSSNMSQTCHYHSPEILTANCSLVQVYICFAIGKTFLNLDILRPLGILRGTIKKAGRTPWDEDYEEDEGEGLLSRTCAIDSNFYRCFMPFSCAQELCDWIMPDRLAYRVASFMGDLLPYYHSGSCFPYMDLHGWLTWHDVVSVFIKFAMDLRFNVEREYVMELVSQHAVGSFFK